MEEIDGYTGSMMNIKRKKIALMELFHMEIGSYRKNAFSIIGV